MCDSSSYEIYAEAKLKEDFMQNRTPLTTKPGRSQHRPSALASETCRIIERVRLTT